jgi:hypothetical protein
MGSKVRALRQRQTMPRRVPLDYRRFKRAPEIDPREANEVADEVASAMRRGDEEPDQNRKLGRMFEDVLDTLHSKNVPVLGQTTAEREREDEDEAALLLALRRRLRGSLRSQGILLDLVDRDGEGTGYIAIAHDRDGRRFEALFSYREGMELGAESPVGMVDRICGAFHTKIVEARNDYYLRAGVGADVVFGGRS